MNLYLINGVEFESSRILNFEFFEPGWNSDTTTQDYILHILWFSYLKASIAVNALKEIGRKLGKDWDFEQDPCHGWEIYNVGTRVNNVT
ncbi:hypothetical protein Hanom_Chr11g00983631 [Helianthus anomalus]